MKIDFNAHERKLLINNKEFCHKLLKSLVEDSLNDDRKKTIEKILSSRIGNLSVVLEGLGDLGNIQAISRTCESFGVQKMEIVETDGPMKWTNRTSQGAHKWLNMKKWYSTRECLEYLKSTGVQIVSTAFSEKAIQYTDVDFTKPTALLLGNESFGISDVARELSDVECIIPSFGFSQSLNVSVAAGIVLEHASKVNRDFGNVGLNFEDYEFLESYYYFKANQFSRQLIRKYEKDLLRQETLEKS
jgi:tRNA (guanosine-2'-O-)-methyltransferase